MDTLSDQREAMLRTSCSKIFVAPVAGREGRRRGHERVPFSKSILCLHTRAGIGSMRLSALGDGAVAMLSLAERDGAVTIRPSAGGVTCFGLWERVFLPNQR